MRVIQVVNVRWYNATSWYGLYLARLLRDAGHDSLVLCLPGTETHEKALEQGLDVLPLDLNTSSPAGIVRLQARLAGLVRDFRPDIVNCHRGESFILWGLLRKLMRPGIAAHGFRLVRTRGDQRRPKGNIFNRWLHNHAADAVIATNSATAAHFRDRIGVPPDRLHVILGGVDRDRYRFDPQGRERVRAEFGYTPGTVVVGLLGRFDRVKGQKELIESIALLRRDLGLANLRLFLIGFETATRLAEVEGWIEANGVGDIVTISGLRPDVAACISSVDVGVISSLWSETIARAALEMMSCGRPLVSTTVGVMPDLLADEALFPPGDVRAMAETIARAATDESWRARIAADQAERVAGLSGDDFLRQTLAVYQRCLERPA